MMKEVGGEGREGGGRGEEFACGGDDCDVADN